MRDDAVPSIIRAAGATACAAYRSYFDTASRNRHTRRIYAAQARRFFDWAARRGLTLEGIDAPVLAAYRSELAAATSPQTAGLHLAPIRGVFRLLAESGALAANPCASRIPPLPVTPGDGPPPPMPQTPEEWQDVVDAAHMALTLDSLVQYGLLEGGPSVNADRCYEILELGRSLGYTPQSDVGAGVHE